MVTVVALDFAGKKEKSIPPDQAAAAIAQGQYCWIDVEGQEVDQVLPLLAGLGFDRAVAAEVLKPDCLSTYSVFPDCLHFAVREGRWRDGVLTVVPLDVLLNKGCMVTFHPARVELIERIRLTYREDFFKFSKSPGYLIYEVADHLIAGYRATLLALNEKVERVQLKLFGEADDEIFKQVSSLTRDLLTFRRVLLGVRELMHELASRRSPFVCETTQPFLEIMAGTLERLGNDLTTERDVLAETLNLYMGMVGHRTSRLLKRLTIISIIFLPLTFLCGVYGMNFEYMPEVHWRYGYAAFWAVVLTLLTSLLVLRLTWWRKWFEG